MYYILKLNLKFFIISIYQIHIFYKNKNDYQELNIFTIIYYQLQSFIKLFIKYKRKFNKYEIVKNYHIIYYYTKQFIWRKS